MPRENQLSRHIIRSACGASKMRLFYGYTYQLDLRQAIHMRPVARDLTPRHSPRRGTHHPRSAVSHVLKPAYYQNKNPALKEFFVGALPNQPPSSSQIV